MNVSPLIVAFALLPCSVSFVSAEKLASDPPAALPLESIQKDIKDAQQRLTQQREVIASWRNRLSKLVRSSLKNGVRRGSLGKKHYTAAQNDVFTDSQLRDYGLMLETFLLPGEAKYFPKAINGIHQSESTTGLPVQRLEKRLAILEAGLDRLENQLGGATLKAEAVAPDGEVKPGTFALAGPALWFVSDDQKLAGAVVREKGSQMPRVRPGDREAIQTVIAGGEAPLSIDVTGGKALALASLESDRLDIFRKGGFWIWPILGIALVSAIAGVLKLIQIVRIRTPENNWVAGILESVRAGEMESARAKAQLIGVQNKLQGGLPFIAITAATAPLLGLLGTVAGMIRTFNVITVSGTGDAKPLAGGISEALITTLFGLVVAIPALIIHALLSRRCQGIIQNTEKLGLTLVNGLRKNSKL